ncbi:hypothetical protein N9L06_00305 [Mariniblastus sp.]|nr:hypothetical protein [Mariniblastus sp.]
MDEEFVDLNDVYGKRNENPTGHPSTSNEVPKDGLHRAVGWLALVLLILAAAFFYSDESWFSSAKDKTQNQSAGASNVPTNVNPSRVAKTQQPSGSDLVSDKIEELTGLNIPGPIKRDWAKEEEIAANRSAVANFKNKLELISQLANSNAEELVLLQSKTEDLLTSQAGAKIASDAKYVEQYMALQEKVAELEVAIPMADNFASDMLGLLKRVEGANDTSYSPQQFVVTRAGEFVKQHSKKSAEIKRFENALNGVIAETAHLEAGPTLDSAVQSQRKTSEENVAESLVQTGKEAKKKAQQQLEEALKAQIQSEADLERAKIEAETAGNIEKRGVFLSNAAKQKLEREFNADLNSINVYLLPFISEGRNMRGNAQGKGPVSFSAIKAKGALENTADGLSNLSHAAKNGRPLGEFPINIRPFMITNNSTEGNFYNTSKYRSIEKYLEKAQSLLNKYGTLMVEKEMLAE